MIKSIDLCLRFCVNCFICLFLDKRFPYKCTLDCITASVLIKKFIKLFPVSREENRLHIFILSLYTLTSSYFKFWIGFWIWFPNAYYNMVNVKHRTVHLYWLKLLSNVVLSSLSLSACGNSLNISLRILLNDACEFPFGERQNHRHSMWKTFVIIIIICIVIILLFELVVSIKVDPGIESQPSQLMWPRWMFIQNQTNKFQCNKFYFGYFGYCIYTCIC